VGAAIIYALRDNTRLQFYLERNNRFAEWVKNPALVPRHLWYEALQLAVKAGEDTLFRGLRKVLGSIAMANQGR